MVSIKITNALNDFTYCAFLKTHQTSKNEEDHKGSSKYSLAMNVTITDSRHCYQQEVDTFPVCKMLGILEVFERVAAVF